MLGLQETGSSDRGIQSIKDVQFSGSLMENFNKMLDNAEKGEHSLRRKDDNSLVYVPEESLTEIFDISAMLRDAAMITVYKWEVYADSYNSQNIGEHYGLQSRLMWECQRHITKALQNKGMHEPLKNSVADEDRKHIIFLLHSLLTLSFPTIAARFEIEKKSDSRMESTLSLLVQPLLGPQLFAINLQFIESFQRLKISYTAPILHDFIIAEKSGKVYIYGNDRFSRPTDISKEPVEWKKWIDAYHGRMLVWPKSNNEDERLPDIGQPENYPINFESPVPDRNYHSDTNQSDSHEEGYRTEFKSHGMEVGPPNLPVSVLDSPFCLRHDENWNRN